MVRHKKDGWKQAEIIYREFKSTYAWENYLSWVTIRAHRITLSRLRTSCHQLEIEVGRHHKPPIPENKSKYCSTSSIDNKTHFLLECPATDSLRQTLWNTVQSLHPHFLSNIKLILASTNKNIVCKAASYTYRAFEHRKRLTAIYHCHKATLSRKQVKIMINSTPVIFPLSLYLHYLLQPQLCQEQIFDTL